MNATLKIHRPWRAAGLVLLLAGLVACSRSSLPWLKDAAQSNPYQTRTPFDTLTPLPTGTPTATFEPPVGMGTPLPNAGEVIAAANAPRLAPLAEYGKGIPIQIVSSIQPVNLLALATTRGVYVIDALTHAELFVYHSGEVYRCVAFSPDGDRLAAGTQNGRIDILNVADGSLLTSIKVGRQPLIGLAFSSAQAGEQRLAASTADGDLFTWRVNGWWEDFHISSAHTAGTPYLAFAPDGGRLFSYLTHKKFMGWDLGRTIADHDQYIGEDETGRYPINAAFSASGEVLASNHGLRMRIFNTEDGTTRALVREDGAPARFIALSADGSQMAVVKDSQINLWKTDGPELIGNLSIPSGESLRLGVFLGDGRRFVGLSQRLIFWNLEALEAEPVINPPEFSTAMLRTASQPEAGGLLWGLFDNSLSALRFSDGEARVNGALPPENLVSLALSNDQSLAAGTSSGKGLLTWKIARPTPAVLADVNKPSQALAISADGSRIAAGTWDGKITVWDLKGNVLGSTTLTEAVQEVLFTADNAGLIVRSEGGVALWRFDRAGDLKLWSGYAAAMSPDGHLFAVASGSDLRKVELRSQQDGALLATLEGAGSSTLAFSPDGNLLAVGGDPITLWQVGGDPMPEKSVLLRTLSSEGLFGSLAFSQDGSLLVLLGWDGCVRVWGLRR